MTLNGSEDAGGRTGPADERVPHSWARLESLITELTGQFGNLAPEQVDGQIEAGLRAIVQHLGLERSTLAQASRDGSDLTTTHSWALPGIPPVPSGVGGADCPAAFEHLMRREPYAVASVEQMPREAWRDQKTLRRIGNRSTLFLPLVSSSGRVEGVLNFGTVSREQEWPPALVERLQLAAGVFACALERKRSDEELRAALAEIERLRRVIDDKTTREVGREQAAPLRIIGRSEAIRHVLELVEQVAPTDAPVLLMGETGVGKELIAEALHAKSPRRIRPMMRVNCAALPGSLIESELFGREKGAYTGALTRQAGRFEVADGSTLFLDEVGELSLETQAKLLRVLQNGEFERLGSSRTTRTDVRIVAATNRNLEKEVGEGRFRADLFYRLAVFPIVVPPLRDRREDIPLLARAIIDQLARKMGKNIDPISDEGVERLCEYSWPGNVRELHNVVERALILSRGSTLAIDLPPAAPEPEAPSLVLDDVERRHIVSVLERTRWRIRGEGGAAALVGLPPTTLETRMAKLGIRRPAHARHRVANQGIQ